MGLRVTKPSEVVPAIEKMLSTPAPVVLDVCVDKDECVFPMVPAGGANTDMILAPPTREVRVLVVVDLGRHSVSDPFS